MSLEQAKLRSRISWLTWIMILGLVISGLTTIPLKRELDWIGGYIEPHSPDESGSWFGRVHEAIRDTDRNHPFLFYGTDWLAFGHFAIAIAFVGALRHPVRNRWLFDFGLIACALVIPYALVMGAVRGIPLWWRLIDCSFGVLGAVPMFLCRRDAIRLEATHS